MPWRSSGSQVPRGRTGRRACGVEEWWDLWVSRQLVVGGGVGVDISMVFYGVFYWEGYIGKLWTCLSIVAFIFTQFLCWYLKFGRVGQYVDWDRWHYFRRYLIVEWIWLFWLIPLSSMISFFIYAILFFGYWLPGCTHSHFVHFVPWDPLVWWSGLASVSMTMTTSNLDVSPWSRALRVWAYGSCNSFPHKSWKWKMAVSETIGGTHFPLPWLMGGRVVRFDELTKWMLHSRWFREANYRTERLGQRMSGAVKEFGNVICCVLVVVDIQ